MLPFHLMESLSILFCSHTGRQKPQHFLPVHIRFFHCISQYNIINKTEAFNLRLIYDIFPPLKI